MKPAAGAGLIVLLSLAMAFGAARPNAIPPVPSPAPFVAQQLPMLPAYTEEP